MGISFFTIGEGGGLNDENIIYLPDSEGGKPLFIIRLEGYALRTEKPLTGMCTDVNVFTNICFW
jgi:hypothetical protein